MYIHVCKGKSKVVRVLLLIKPQAKKTYGEWSIDPRILNLGTGWRQVVSFTFRVALLAAKEPSVPIGWEMIWAPEPA
jgi:hypothetical protein